MNHPCRALIYLSTATAEKVEDRASRQLADEHAWSIVGSVKDWLQDGSMRQRVGPNVARGPACDGSIELLVMEQTNRLSRDLEDLRDEV